MAQQGWASPAEGDNYFLMERSVTDLWDALADDAAKNKVLNASYNRLYYHPEIAVPEAGDETAAQLVVLIKAQSEMAYYLLMHLEDQDRRKGIQVQGVTTAGIVKEVYDKDRAEEVPIPPIVWALLDAFVDRPSMAVVDLGRDEDEDFDYNAVDNDT